MQSRRTVLTSRSGTPTRSKADILLFSLMCCAADKPDIILVLLLLYEYKYDEQYTQSACYLIPYERKAYLSSISTLIQTCILDFYRIMTTIIYLTQRSHCHSVWEYSSIIGKHNHMKSD